MKLDFSNKKIPEILSEFQDKNTFQWQNDIFDLMKKIDSKEEKVNFIIREKIMFMYRILILDL
jgi:hypothetical protein